MFLISRGGGAGCTGPQAEPTEASHQCHNPTVASFYGSVETKLMDRTLWKRSAAAAQRHVAGSNPCLVICRSKVFQTCRLETGSNWF